MDDVESFLAGVYARMSQAKPDVNRTKFSLDDIQERAIAPISHELQMIMDESSDSENDDTEREPAISTNESDAPVDEEPSGIDDDESALFLQTVERINALQVEIEQRNDATKAIVREVADLAQERKQVQTQADQHRIAVNARKLELEKSTQALHAARKDKEERDGQCSELDADLKFAEKETRALGNSMRKMMKQQDKVDDAISSSKTSLQALEARVKESAAGLRQINDAREQWRREARAVAEQLKQARDTADRVVARNDEMLGWD
ncbi:chromosome segregation protein [Carpediemonas membranifera]|uniref:Chromosome segregation protein n=1 Tax=Carpediemonas membranifera TaxID=201153 RepID=A0A8J6E001_9EUKA|nr:chromosome segregation protein [Carpediemonas membranifera]|eukprot:KAG9391136.1 chromosome segregation protein [Carpediemonas membranifera]